MTGRRMVDAELRDALALGHIQVLSAVLLHLSGNPRWWSDEYRPARTRGLEDHRDGGVPPERQQEIRDGVAELLSRWDEHQPMPEISAERLVEIATFAFGEEVPPEYGRLIADVLGARVSSGRTRETPRTPHVDTPMRVAVIGAGVSGILASIRLQAMGIEHVVLEKEPEVGGAWQNNSYPGCGVDTPSYLYSYSFHQHDWSTHYGKRDEVHAYFVDVARANAVHRYTRFNTEVTRLTWDERARNWQIEATTDEGPTTLRADVVIAGVGQLSRPKLPDIPGLDSFSGALFHSSDWPAGLEVTGKRVALVGAGASAMQIGPAIVDQVRELKVFQRSPHWIAPADIYFAPFDHAEHVLMARVPLYLQWYRARLAWVYNDRVHPSLQVDPQWSEPELSINAVNAGHRRYYVRYIKTELEGRPDLIEKSIPNYPPFGKRMLLDNGWYRMLRRDHVELITEGVSAVTPTGLVDTNGDEHEADVIVFATGFHADRFLYPMTVIGRDGRTSAETWGEHDARAYLGIASPNFPNLFFMGGPNTLLGHGGSYVTIAEMQMDYIAELLATMAREDIAVVECRPEVCDRYVAAVDEAHARMVWTHPGMSNWYRNPDGRVTAVIPWRIVDYGNMVRHPNLDDFVITKATVAAEGGIPR